MNQGPNLKRREALALFADELGALNFLKNLLWPDGVHCPRCGPTTTVRELNGKTSRLGTYKCYGCRKPFSVLHGTLMCSSHVPAHKWLQALYLTDGGTKPMQASRLGLILNVSSKTAASMMRRIGKAADQLHYNTSHPKPQVPPMVPEPLGTNSVSARKVPVQLPVY